MMIVDLRDDGLTFCRDTIDLLGFEVSRHLGQRDISVDFSLAQKSFIVTRINYQLAFDLRRGRTHLFLSVVIFTHSYF